MNVSTPQKRHAALATAAAKLADQATNGTDSRGRNQACRNLRSLSAEMRALEVQMQDYDDETDKRNKYLEIEGLWNDEVAQEIEEAANNG